MKKMKRALAALLAMAFLLLVACSGGKGEMGRYVEEDITPPQAVSLSNPVCLPDGRIALLCTREETRQLAILDEQGQWQFIPTQAKGDSLWWDEQAQGFFTSTQGRNMQRLSLDGQAQKLSWKPKESVLEGKVLRWAVPAADGGVLAGGEGMPPSLYDADGTLLRELSLGTVSRIARSSAGLYLYTQDGAVYHWDGTLGGEAKKLPGVSGAVGAGYANAMAADAQGGIYIKMADGILHLKQGATQWEPLLGKQLFAISSPEMEVSGMAVDAKGALIALVHPDTDQNSGPDRLMLYRWDKTLPAPTISLSIASLYEDSTIRQAAMLLQKSKPDEIIEYEALIRQGESLAAADAIRILNTRMLSGTGPDVLMLDGLDIQRYAAGGLLMDLSEWAQPYIDGGQWLPGVAASLADEQGRVYSVPARIGFNALWGKPEELEQAGTLEQWMDFAARQPQGRPNVFPITLDEWIRLLYETCSPAWPRDAKGRILFDSPEFIRYLESVRILSKNSLLEESERLNSYTDAWIQNMKVIYEDQYAFGMDVTAASIGNITMQFSLHYGRAQGQPGMIALPGQASNVYQPQLSMGVNSRTRHQGLALELLGLLFSGQIQDQMAFTTSSPVLVESFDKLIQERSSWYKAEIKGHTFRWIHPDGWSLEGHTPDETWFHDYRSIIHRLDTPGYPPSPTIAQAIKDEIQPFMEGHITAQQAAQAIAKRLEAYLAE